MNDSTHAVSQWVLHLLHDEFGDAIHRVDATTYELPVGSTKVIIDVMPAGNGTVVNIVAPLVFYVRPDPELFELVARQVGAPGLGHLRVKDSERPGLLDVLVASQLNGDDIDRSELITTVAVLGGYADDTDDALAARFGGQVLRD
ncbi:MAG TPA: hypothetical protein PLB21_14905 [Actinomycetota bacterium]|jgi:hypothetical protein|nr:hypothetical protein [Actinomycetota bacterium]